MRRWQQVAFIAIGESLLLVAMYYWDKAFVLQTCLRDASMCELMAREGMTAERSSLLRHLAPLLVGLIAGWIPLIVWWRRQARIEQQASCIPTRSTD